MSDQPFDPAANKTQTEKNEDTDTFVGQQGYDVQYEDGQYQNESAEDMSGQMRSGSFETNNIGDQTASQGYPQASPSGGPSSTGAPDPNEPPVEQR